MNSKAFLSSFVIAASVITWGLPVYGQATAPAGKVDFPEGGAIGKFAAVLNPGKSLTVERETVFRMVDGVFEVSGRGVEETMNRSGITSMTSFDRSPMPVGIEGAVSVEQMADLMVFLRER